MRIPWLVPALLAVVTLQPVAPSASGGAAPSADVTSSVPTLVDVRAAHHAGFDRVVFEFRGGLPDARVRYVDRLIADGSGRRVRIAGQAVLRVRLEPARAHTGQGTPTAAPRRRAFALPNLMTAVRASDFEAVTTYGLGLARRTRFTVSTLPNPSRVVIDIRAAFPTVQRRVWFLDVDRFVANEEPFFTSVVRPVRPSTPATGLMDRLFAGPLPQERAAGLRLLRSRATGYTGLSVVDGVARVRLLGGCSSGGSTVTIAGEILPTLRQLPTVQRVTILDPDGNTLDPDGPGDSTPECLEP